MDKWYKIGLTVLRTFLFLGIGTGACIRELFYKDSPNMEVVLMGWGMMLGEGIISAWILSKFATTEQPSQHPSS